MTREEAIKVVRNIYQTDAEKKALETLIPELTESEDERIRTTLKEAFEAYDIESSWNGIPIRSIFTWLEKQKEQKPHTDEEKEYVRTIKSIISDFIRDKKPENLAYYQRIYDWLDGRHVPFSCSRENGEQEEWSEERMLRTIISDGIAGAQWVLRKINER